MSCSLYDEPYHGVVLLLSSHQLVFSANKLWIVITAGAVASCSMPLYGKRG